MLSRWTSRTSAFVLGLVLSGSALAVDFVVSDDGRPAVRPTTPAATQRYPMSAYPQRPGVVTTQNPYTNRYPDPSLQQRPVVRNGAAQFVSSGVPGIPGDQVVSSDSVPYSSGQFAPGRPPVPDNYWNPGTVASNQGNWFDGMYGPGTCQDSCNPCGEMLFPSSCETPCGGGAAFFFDMWLAQGFTGNYDDPNNNFNLPMIFNDRANEYQMNQLYVSFGKKVRDGGECWDLGGRMDLLYGTDYFFTQARGLETRSDFSNRWNSGDGPRAGGTAALYGLAMPQVYAELYAPVLSGINFKVGHFYTTLGYESVMAPANFFYSHAYTVLYAEPITHTGVLASFPMSTALNGHFGYTRGWNNWEDNNGQPGFLTGLTWNCDDCSALSFALHTGDEDDLGVNNRVVYSLVYTRQLCGGMRWVIQHDFGSEANGAFDDQFRPHDAKWYGINNYFFWDISRTVTGGIRAEWFRDQDNARVLAIPFESLSRGGNYFELTGGLNVKLGQRWMFRPEIRWDWSDVVPPGGGGMFNDFTEDGQITASFDLIFQL